ncbi:MAG: bifunctional glutamate N-acetyltransferase/amino-acid acetyltransferase ArgJ [Deltaproteobacteria bacterium]|nr:bifunctional glutamate N-acetyltransferase/amino-acid acetyltransferase ArgJ [Deltaproteobacteria bacterium]
METNTTIKGFKAAYTACGLKKNNAYDIALIYSETPAVSAALFTTNRVKAAPVILSMENIVNGSARAIIVNAGNANACTGEEGLRNARETIRMVAEGLNILPAEVLIASTGVIGAQLDMKKIEKAIPELVKNLDPSGINGVVKAIMTTDSFPKVSTFSGSVKGVEYHIMGIAKGAGMIMPNMATMLCFIITDINISRPLLKKALAEGVNDSFNKITVDGDTSTNDTVFVMANGKARNDEPDEASFNEFKKGLTRIMYDLAKMIVKDGEGATKVIHINVKGASSSHDAKSAARTIANSSLVKTAFYGEDPNWGRIMAALGRSGIEMKENMVDILIDDIKIVKGGLGQGVEREKEAAAIMKNPEIFLTVELNIGEFSDWITTCDLTHDYVSINADYRS